LRKCERQRKRLNKIHAYDRIMCKNICEYLLQNHQRSISVPISRFLLFYDQDSCDRHSQRDWCARTCLCVHTHELFMQYPALTAILATS